MRYSVYVDSFVNRSGQELPQRYGAAVRQLSTHLWRRFPSIVDPTDRDSCIEHTLRRVADHEEKHGQANDLPSLIWRIFPEVAASLLRKSHYKLPVHSVDQPVLDGLAVDRGAAQALEARLYAAQVLAGLDDRTSEILHLRFLEGMSVAETAKTLRISEVNVRQLCHRGVEQLRRKQQSQSDD